MEGGTACLDGDVRVGAVDAVAEGLGADPAAARPCGGWLEGCVHVLVVGVDDGGRSSRWAGCYSEVVQKVPVAGACDARFAYASVVDYSRGCVLGELTAWGRCG